MILNVLHLPHPLPDRSISTSNNRCVSPPSVYAKFLATRTHTHAPKHSRNARAEKEGGRLGFAPNCRNPNRARFWNFRRARHSIDSSNAAYLSWLASSRPPSWKRSPRAPFFIIGVSSMWLLTFRAGMIFDYSYSVEKKKYFLFFFKSARIQRNFNFV